MFWTVYILGKEYEVEAEESYQARKQGAELYKKETGSNKSTTYFMPACRVRRHEDKRIKYDF